MANTTYDEGTKIYEVGYLFISSIPKEKVAAETAALKDMLAKAGAVVIAGEDPELITLAYQMTKKINGVHQRFDEAYFGWVKFELPGSAIESVKKSIDAMESVLRHLLMTTVRENTYLGKRSPSFFISRTAGMIAPEGAPHAAHAVSEGDIVPSDAAKKSVEKDDMTVSVGATNVEDMDKSIDAMVKGV